MGRLRFATETAADLAMFTVGMTGLLALGFAAASVGVALKVGTRIATDVMVATQDLAGA